MKAETESFGKSRFHGRVDVCRTAGVVAIDRIMKDVSDWRHDLSKSPIYNVTDEA